MGLNFHLHCMDCKEDSTAIEYSAVPYYELKHGSEDQELMVHEWTPFLVVHSGHKIELLDAFNKRKDPKKVTGLYILGIKKNLVNLKKVK